MVRDRNAMQLHWTASRVGLDSQQGCNAVVLDSQQGWFHHTVERRCDGSCPPWFRVEAF